MNLNHRIKILTETSIQDDYGQEIKDWVAGDPIRANVRAIKTSEKFSADKQLARVDLIIRMRRRDWLTTQHRIEWKGRIYKIDGHPTDVNGKRQYMEIACHDLGTA